MRKFIFKITFFTFAIIILFFVLIFITSKIVKNRGFNNSQTESVLLVMKPKTHYDLMFIGNSHARNFSRHNNHERVEKILNKKIFNIGKSGGLCGNNEYLFYMNYCFSKNITADTIIHNIFSQMLYDNFTNKASNTFNDEPFSLNFLVHYVNYPYAQNRWQRLFYYLRSKISKKWLKTQPFSIKERNDSLLFIDSAAIEKGFKRAYKDGFDTVVFIRNAKITEELIKTAQKNGSTIIFITTPTLFGDWPHHEDIVDFMGDMNKKYGVKYYDFASCVKNPHLFYDHHHLNTKGIVYFTEKYLKPALENGDSTYLVH